jgi:hypothetical protein
MNSSPTEPDEDELEAPELEPWPEPDEDEAVLLASSEEDAVPPLEVPHAVVAAM